jgi:hypothetical protein
MEHPYSIRRDRCHKKYGFPPAHCDVVHGLYHTTRAREFLGYVKAASRQAAENEAQGCSA